MFLLRARIIWQRLLWVARQSTRGALALLPVLAALALSACSAIKFGYEQSPALGYWWLDGYLDFDSEQSPQVRQALQRLQQWHRQHELPLYAQTLGRAATLAEGPLDAQQVCQFQQAVQQHVQVLAKEALTQLAPLVLTFSPAQLRHLSTQLEKKNSDWDEEWLQGSPSARLQRRLDKAVNRHADFYGSLTPAQTELLRQLLEQSLWTPEWGRQERLRQQQDLLAQLLRIQQERPSASTAQALLQGVWQRWQTPPDAADRERWQAWWAQGCKNLAELHNSTSAQQRQRAARRLRAYERDLRELSQRP